MKKFVLAAFCTVSFASFVMAEEFTAMITKVDGSKIHYYKTKAADGAGAGAGKKGGGFGGGFGGAKSTIVGDLVVTPAASSVKVLKKGMFDADTKTFGDNVPVEGGLNDDMFKTVQTGFNVTLTTADSGPDKGNITQIVVGGAGFGGGKGAGGKKGFGKKGGQDD